MQRRSPDREWFPEGESDAPLQLGGLDGTNPMGKHAPGRRLVRAREADRSQSAVSLLQVANDRVPIANSEELAPINVERQHPGDLFPEPISRRSDDIHHNAAVPGANLNRCRNPAVLGHERKRQPVGSLRLVRGRREASHERDGRRQ